MLTAMRPDGSRLDDIFANWPGRVSSLMDRIGSCLGGRLHDAAHGAAGADDRPCGLGLWDKIPRSGSLGHLRPVATRPTVIGSQQTARGGPAGACAHWRASRTGRQGCCVQRPLRRGGRARLAAALPIVGPAAAAAGEQGARGDVAGAIGSGLGLALPAALGAVAPDSIPVAPALESANPVDAAAVALAQRAGVPLDAATATGNRFVKAAQHVSDRSLGGSMVAGRRRRRSARARDAR